MISDENKNNNSENNNNENSNEFSKDQNMKQENQKKCCLELNEFKNRCLYLAAEFENYKKRTEKERVQCLFDGEAMVIKDLLPVYDDFLRAFEQVDKDKLKKEDEAHLEGFRLILKSFDKLFAQYSIEEISYDEFNPEYHEALMQVESDDKESGKIIEVLQRGYKHKGKLLRPAKVSVSK